MPVTHRSLLVVVGVLLGAALVGLVALWPSPDPVEGPAGVPIDRLVRGEILEITPTGGDQFGLLPDAVEIEITARLDDDGSEVTFRQVDDTGDTFREGQRVMLDRIPQLDADDVFYIADFQRERPLALLTAMFLIAVVAFGRWHGVRALIGLSVTAVLIVGFIVPAILDGQSPLAVALVGATLIMVATLYLAHGFSAKTTAAVVGTAIALGITGLLAVGFASAASLTGFTSDEARLATMEVGGLSLSGLLLAGIIIGGLGVLDDVTMSQASTVFELRRANPAATSADLVRGALNVGRDHVAATVNTLFLAYAGAALPLLLLFSVGDAGFLPVVTSELVAVEIVRTLVGSIGLIAAVPATSALAAALAVAATDEQLAAGGHHHHHGPVAPAEAVAGAPEQRPRSPDPEVEVEGFDRGEAGSDDPVSTGWEERLRRAYELDESSDEAGTSGTGQPPEGPTTPR